MSIDPDAAARAGVLAWERFAGAVSGASVVRQGGVLALVTGVRLPGFNGIWGETREVDPDAVAHLLDDIRAADVPHCMQLRPGWPARVDEIAQERGLVRVPGEPIMTLETRDRLVGPPLPRSLSVRQLAPEDASIHVRVAAAGQVVGEENAYRQVVTPELLSEPWLACYVGEVDGAAVTTALSVTLEGSTGIFSVATLPEHRRQGYGGAVTERAVRDGFDNGAQWVWLSASDAGYPVYRALGFEPIEHLDFWIQRRK